MRDVVGVDARRVERRAVVRHVVVGVAQRPVQPLELQRRQLVAARRLDRLEIAGLAGSFGPASSVSYGAFDARGP